MKAPRCSSHLANDNEEKALSLIVPLSLGIENSIYKKKADKILKEMGLNSFSYHTGFSENVQIRPRDDDAPDGLFKYRKGRKWQVGLVRSNVNGFRYRFITDDVIDGLEPGVEVEMIILKTSKEGKPVLLIY